MIEDVFAGVVTLLALYVILRLWPWEKRRRW